MRQSACLVINPITVDNFATLSKCTPVDLADEPDLKLFILVGKDRSSFSCCLVHWGSTDNFRLLQICSGVVWQPRDLQLPRNTLCPLSPCLCFFTVLKVKRMQRPGSEAIRTQVQPSRPNPEITKTRSYVYETLCPQQM